MPQLKRTAAFNPATRLTRTETTSTPASTGAASPSVDKTACERAGCLQYCGCQPQDPWIYAIVGFGIGGVILGGTMYYMGKNKRRR